LVRLSSLPPIFVPVVTLVLMLVGLTAPLFLAIPALLVILAFVSWLAYLSWPVLPTGARVLRGVMVGAVVIALVGRISGFCLVMQSAAPLVFAFVAERGSDTAALALVATLAAIAMISLAAIRRPTSPA